MTNKNKLGILVCEFFKKEVATIIRAEGMLIVNSLVKQVHGTLDLDGTGGTRFTIKFKKTENRGRFI